MTIFGKLKALWALMTDGLTGILKFFLKDFNTKILGKIKKKEDGQKYLKDVLAAHTFVKTIFDNHSKDFSEEKRKRGEAILVAIEEFSKAIEDFEVNETEFKRIIKKVNAAIDSFKKAK